MEDIYYTEKAIRERIRLYGEIAKLKRTIDKVGVSEMRDIWYDPGTCESGKHVPTMFTAERMACGNHIPSVWMHILVDLVQNGVVTMDQVRIVLENYDELSQIMNAAEKRFVARFMEFVLLKEKEQPEMP